MLEGAIAGKSGSVVVKKLDRNNISGYNKEEIIKKLHKHVEARN